MESLAKLVAILFKVGCPEMAVGEGVELHNDNKADHESDFWNSHQSEIRAP